jgi:hypothetical protein
MSIASSRIRKRVAGIALIGAITGAGVMATTMAASAADNTPTAASSSTTAPDAGTPAPGGTVDESKSVRSDEHLLTGTDATKATAAALAKYPGATIQRVETDSAGVYEAHLTTTAGERLIVQMDATFTVTGNDTSGPPSGTHGPAAPATTTAG